MIIDKIQKLNKFLKGKPVAVLHSNLDSFSSFFTDQVKYAQFIALSAIISSLFSSIIPLVGKSDQTHSQYYVKNVIEASDSSAASLKPLVGSVVLVKSGGDVAPSSVVLNKFTKSVNPFVERIKRLPLSFILSYSVSRPREGVQFRMSWKSYQRFGQIQIYSERDGDTRSGFFIDGYSLVKPVIPVVTSQIARGEVQRSISHAFYSFRSYMSDLFAVDNAGSFGQDGYNVLNDDVPSPSDSPVLGASQSASGLARSRGVRGIGSNQSALVDSTLRFQKFVQHITKSAYFKFDWLNTFIIRVEQ